MATVMDPKLGENGEHLKWNPTNIPPSKPFINVTTSACKPVSTDSDMHFVKTKSLVYSPFHKEACYINFEVGYNKNLKWLDHIHDKWTEYANFFVAGFLEAIYLTGGKTYAQIDAKSIDFDIRFRHPNTPGQPVISSNRSSNNAFAQRRNHPTSNNSPSTPKSTFISRKNSVIMEEARDDTSDNDLPMEEVHNNPKGESADDGELSRFMEYYRKFKAQESRGQDSSLTSGPFYLDTSTIVQSPLSSKQTPVCKTKKHQLLDIINVDDESDHLTEEPVNELAVKSEQTPTPAHKTRKRQLSDLCNIDDEPDQLTEEPIEPINEPAVQQKRANNRTGGCGRGRGKK